MWFDLLGGGSVRHNPFWIQQDRWTHTEVGRDPTTTRKKDKKKENNSINLYNSLQFHKELITNCENAVKSSTKLVLLFGVEDI